MTPAQVAHTARAALREAPQAEGWVMVPLEIVNRFPEINHNNYDHDDACALNAWALNWCSQHVPAHQQR